MHGQPWNPLNQFYAAQKLEVDHAVCEKGQRITLRLVPQFQPDEPVKEELSAVAVLEPNGRELGRWTGVRTGWTAPLEAPELPTGQYKFAWKLEALPAKTVSVVSAPGSRALTRELQDRAAKLTEKAGAGLPSVLYALSLYDMADQSRIEPPSIDLLKQLREAEKVSQLWSKGGIHLPSVPGTCAGLTDRRSMENCSPLAFSSQPAMTKRSHSHSLSPSTAWVAMRTLPSTVMATEP